MLDKQREINVMPCKKQPKKFVVDTVVEALGKMGLIRNTELEEDLKQLGLSYAESHDKYSIDWFDGTFSIESESDLTLCKGIKDISICDRCEYRFKCWTNRR